MKITGYFRLLFSFFARFILANLLVLFDWKPWPTLTKRRESWLSIRENIFWYRWGICHYYLMRSCRWGNYEKRQKRPHLFTGVIGSLTPDMMEQGVSIARYFIWQTNVWLRCPNSKHTKPFHARYTNRRFLLISSKFPMRWKDCARCSWRRKWQGSLRMPVFWLASLGTIDVWSNNALMTIIPENRYNVFVVS